MEEKFRCLRCGFEQPPTNDCRQCQVNIPKYNELQKRRNFVPGKTSRQRETETAREAPSAERISKPEKTPERSGMTYYYDCLY